MKKIILIFFSFIASFTIVFPFCNNAGITYLTANAEETNLGQLSVYLFYYTYGGAYNRYKEYSDNKFQYNSSKKQYIIETVLFAGDFFAPNITGQGFAYYNDKLSDETKQKLASQNITAHTGGNQFHVNKSGTYHISISDTLDSYSKVEDFYKIWDDENTAITYVSESIDFVEPLGNNNICLIGNFDGIGWNGSRNNNRYFSFNPSSNCYEFYYNLYEGDEFCPESSDHGRIRYYDSEYSEKMFIANHIEKSNNGYFLCKKDGFYKISIDYKVEYFHDSSFLWSEEVGSTISFLGEPSKPISKGNETIVLIGKINGNEYMNNSSTHSFYFDSVRMQYLLRLYFHKGDYFCPYLKNKGKSAYCLTNNPFLKKMCEGINVDFVSSNNLPMFLIDIPGYYEIALGANIDSLEETSYCWLPHGNSYIRLIGNNVKSIFVSSKNRLGTIDKIYTSGDNEIKQYGLEGIKVNAVNYIKLDSTDAQGYFYKIDYDPTYTNNIEIHNDNNEKVETLQLIPDASNCYDFETGKKNASLGNACSFLSTLSTCFEGIACGTEYVADYTKISAEQAEQLLKQYDKLDMESKNHVDKALISTIDSQGNETQIHYTDIAPFLKLVIDKEKREEKTKTILYITGAFVLFLFIGFIALSSKRKRSKNVINVSKNSNDSETITIDI